MQVEHAGPLLRGQFAGDLARIAKQKEGLQNTYERSGGTPDLVIIPSISVAAEELRGIKGVDFYELRQLWTVLLTSSARKIVFVSLRPVDELFIEYLAAAAGRTLSNVVLLSLPESGDDAQTSPLTHQILDNPDFIARLRDHFDPARTVLMPWICSEAEHELGRQLGIPVEGPDVSLTFLGTKTGSHWAFDQAGVASPACACDLFSEADVVSGMVRLVRAHPTVRRFVLKLNLGVSGLGNADLLLPRRLPPDDAALSVLIADTLARRLVFQDPHQNWAIFSRRLSEVGGVVEVYLTGQGKTSPSAQVFISAGGEVQVISTHDQVLGGATGMVFEGAIFPADSAYRRQVIEQALKIGATLAKLGVVGHFGIDFLAVPPPDPSAEKGWQVWAIEINLRQGGTTHLYHTAKLVCGATYDARSGLLFDRNGRSVSYAGSDCVQGPVGQSAARLLAIMRSQSMLYDSGAGEGLVFHLLNLLAPFGKTGLVAIAHERANALGLLELARESVAGLGFLDQAEESVAGLGLLDLTRERGWAATTER